MQDERDGEQAFDPFDELVPSVRLEGVFDAVAGRHFYWRFDWDVFDRIRGLGGMGNWEWEGRESGRIVWRGERERGGGGARVFFGLSNTGSR